ncbi:MAG TPA: triose-phosphate isomerase, partial [Mycobacteriales bacterium]|nr:triose-phosphate isomerase [Mycobacteriales bacterium]
FTLDAKDYDAADVVVLPPFVDLRSVQTLVDGDRLRISYGAQDLSPHDGGAYTGDVSGAMLAKLGCSYVVVGHSERRALHGEDDALVRVKVQAALRHGIAPIVCVGESLEIRQAGGHVAHCTASLEAALEGAEPAPEQELVVAYEPVWAIGTGEVATPEDAQEVCAALRGVLAARLGADRAGATRVLYGGSVTAASVAAIMAERDVDGALVGGASLDATQFAAVCRGATGR